MNKLFALGLAGAMAATLAGCSITGGELIRPGEPTATLIIVNGSYGYLDAIVISDCNNFTYGFNRLADGDSIPPGGARRRRRKVRPAMTGMFQSSRITSGLAVAQ